MSEIVLRCSFFLDNHIYVLYPVKITNFLIVGRFYMAMRKRRNLLILAIIILVVAIVLSSFAYMNFQKPYAGNVDISQHGVGFLLSSNTLIYTADNQNYFASNGLKVTFQSYDSGFNAMKGMLNDEVNIALASEFVVAEEALANNSFYTFGSIAKYNIYNVVAQNRQGNSALFQIWRGKNYGSCLRINRTILFGNFLDLNNIDPSKVTLINVPNAQSANALGKRHCGCSGDLSADHQPN